MWEVLGKIALGMAKEVGTWGDTVCKTLAPEGVKVDIEDFNSWNYINVNQLI